MKETWENYSADELIMEAECVEEYGEYQHLCLMQYSAQQLREFAKKAEEKEVSPAENSVKKS